MGTLIGILIIVGIFAFCNWNTNQKMDRIDPTNVDNSKMTRDICNGVSQSEIRRRYGNGYYNKKQYKKPAHACRICHFISHKFLLYLLRAGTYPQQRNREI